MLPIVIPETLITPFKYWLEGIQDGMYHNNELFTLVKFYGPDSRSQVYEDACQLAASNLHVCITVSEQKYCLWQNLKSPAADSQAHLPAKAVAQDKQQAKVLVSP